MRWLVLVATACKADAPPCTSPCVAKAPVSVTHGVIAWDDALRGDKIECRWVAELPNVLLCGARDESALNASLTRASIFIEGPGEFTRTVVARGSEVYQRQLEHIRGFDLLERHPSGHHPDLVSYYAALDAACTKDSSLCADNGEQAMRSLLEHAWAGRPQLVVVTFGGRGSIGDDMVISHELLHAQYFTDPRYRAAIDAYWRALPDPDRTAVRDVLGFQYDRNDDELISNELQAYVLMSGAEQTSFTQLIAPHRAALQAALAAQGITPIQTELRVPKGAW